MFVVLVISVVTSAMSGYGCFQQYEDASIDLAFRVNEFTPSRDTTIIEVRETDVQEHYARSDLERQQWLRDVLVAICRAAPLTIVVDLDANPALLRHEAAREGCGAWPPVVWARDVDVRDGKLHFRHDGDASFDGVPSGVAGFEQDRFGVVRRHRRRFIVEERPEDSLVWAATKVICRSFDAPGRNGVRRQRPIGCSQAELLPEQTADSLVLNFSGDRYRFPRFPAADLLAAAQGAGWGTDSPLANRLVILGGNFHGARDEHLTPVGLMSGAEVTAQAIESELYGRGVGRWSKVRMFGAEVVCGLAIVVLYRRFSLALATRLALVVLPFLAVLASYLSFFTLARWLAFAPVLVGTVMHALYEAATWNERNTASNRALDAAAPRGTDT